MIHVDELARRLCDAGHLAPRRDGPHPSCATHILLARATYPLITPAEQPQGERALRVLLDALAEAGPRPQPVAAGQVGLDEVLAAPAHVAPPTDATFYGGPSQRDGLPDARGPFDV